MKNYLIKCLLLIAIMFMPVIIINAEDEWAGCPNYSYGNYNTQVICHGPVGEWKSTKWCKGTGQNGIWSNIPSGCQSESGVFTICDRCGTTME